MPVNVCTRLHLPHLSLKWRTVQRVKLVSKLIVLEFYLAFMLMILYGGVNIRCHWHGHFGRPPIHAGANENFLLGGR